VTREGLLKRAESAPGAWVGIRIAAILRALNNGTFQIAGFFIHFSRKVFQFRPINRLRIS